jgi:hypothetical protein
MTFLQDVSPSTVLQYPQLYKDTMTSNRRSFLIRPVQYVSASIYSFSNHLDTVILTSNLFQHGHKS